ncbi:MAG TPA: phosphotransferase [Phycisphaerae bacterium]|nr:phosphotransferase [Phycisphaerae bacterium]
MDDRSRQILLTGALPELAERFGLAMNSLTLIQDHRNFVYRSPAPTGEVIFKVLPSAESRHPLLLGEIDWMAHLHAGGVAVPQPCRSLDGNLIESQVVDGWHVSAYCLERIEGRLWQECPNSREVIGPVGRLAGKMHRVSLGYSPAAAGAKLSMWSDMPWFKSPADVIHPSMPRVIARCIELRAALEELPAVDHGPVHNDLHGGNVLVSADGPVVIDFECAHYSGLASEIGSALFFWVWKTPDSQPRDSALRAAEFLDAFMEGYRQEHVLDRRWAASLPLFLKARELSMLATSPCATEDFGSVGRHDRTFAWMKSSFENDVPFVDVDFSRWAT